VRLVRLPSSGGMGPERSMNERWRYSRLVRLKSSGGMGPERLLPRRSREVRLDR
jgi:hypothetical protein